MGIIIKISSKKRWLLNASKQKVIKGRSGSEADVISFFINCGNKLFPNSTLILILNIDIVNVAIIIIIAYYIACNLKAAWVFVVFIKNLEF